MRYNAKWSHAQIGAGSQGILVARALQQQLMAVSWSINRTMVNPEYLRKRADHLRKVQRLRCGRKKVLREVTILPESLGAYIYCLS